MILQVLLFSILFLFLLEHRIVLSAISPTQLGNGNFALCPAADGNKKSWASKMEEMKSITLEIFFWKVFWKDMDGFFPPVREKI